MLLENGKKRKTDKKHGKNDNLKRDGFSARVDLEDGVSVCDPLGMYTGVPEERYEKPVQDADDL